MFRPAHKTQMCSRWTICMCTGTTIWQLYVLTTDDDGDINDDYTLLSYTDTLVIHFTQLLYTSELYWYTCYTLLIHLFYTTPIHFWGILVHLLYTSETILCIMKKVQNNKVATQLQHIRCNFVDTLMLMPIPMPMPMPMIMPMPIMMPILMRMPILMPSILKHMSMSMLFCLWLPFSSEFLYK